MQTSHDMTVGSLDRPEPGYAPTSISGSGRRHMGEGYGEILDTIEDLDDH